MPRLIKLLGLIFALHACESSSFGAEDESYDISYGELLDPSVSVSELNLSSLDIVKIQKGWFYYIRHTRSIHSLSEIQAILESIRAVVSADKNTHSRPQRKADYTDVAQMRFHGPDITLEMHVEQAKEYNQWKFIKRSPSDIISSSFEDGYDELGNMNKLFSESNGAYVRSLSLSPLSTLILVLTLFIVLIKIVTNAIASRFARVASRSERPPDLAQGA